MVWVLLSLGCRSPEPEPEGGQASFCEEPGDFGRALYTMVEAECRRYIDCGIYTEEEYILCVSYQSNSGYILQRETACMDWCAVDDWIDQVDAAGCEADYPSMVDTDGGPIYRCEERNW